MTKKLFYGYTAYLVGVVVGGFIDSGHLHTFGAGVVGFIVGWGLVSFAKYI